MIGGPLVMRAQLRQLIKVSALENVSLRALPFAANAHPGLDGTFSILELQPPGGLTTAIVADASQMSFRDSPEEVAIFITVFERLVATALDESSSLRLIERILSEM
jgi:hypothetical protein